MLASTFISPLFALVTQCTVLALNIFQAFFLSLCDFNSFCLQVDRVRSIPTVRGQVIRNLLHWRVHLLIAEVPVTNSVEVKISHIVALDYGLYLATTYLNFSPAVVLLLKHVGAVLKCSRDVVCFVTKGYLFHSLLSKSANKQAVDLVHRVVVSDHTAIFEFNSTITQIIDVR